MLADTFLVGEAVPMPTFSDESIVIAVASLELEIPVTPSLPILVNATVYLLMRKGYRQVRLYPKLLSMLQCQMQM